MNRRTTIAQFCHKEAGFSLIEVMIGMAILSIGLLAVASMQTSAMRNNKTGNTYTQALALASDQMERIKRANIGSAILSPGALPATIADPNNPVDENGNAGGIYTRTWTIDNHMEDSDGDNIADRVSQFSRTVTVTVTYPFVGDGIRRVELTSVATGGGL